MQVACNVSRVIVMGAQSKELLSSEGAEKDIYESQDWSGPSGCLFCSAGDRTQSLTGLNALPLIHIPVPTLGSASQSPSCKTHTRSSQAKFPHRQGK